MSEEREELFITVERGRMTSSTGFMVADIRDSCLMNEILYDLLDDIMQPRSAEEAEAEEVDDE
jgi:hypothetical protein